MPTAYQGDSLWLDIQIPLFASVDSTWANWSGKFEISTTESATPSVTGTLTRSSQEGIFNLRLNTSNSTWTSLAVGTYKLMVELYNTSAAYKEEKHYKLVIKTQGLT